MWWSNKASPRPESGKWGVKSLSIKKSFNHHQKFSNGQNGGENGIQTKFASSSIFSANWTKLVLLFDSFADSGQKSKIKLLLCRMKFFVGGKILIPTPLPIYLISTLMTMHLKELEDFQFRSALIWVQWIWAEEEHNCIPMRRIGQFRDFQNLECSILSLSQYLLKFTIY